MSNGFWNQPGGDEDNFRDGQDETVEGYEPPPVPVTQRAAPAPRPAPMPMIAPDYEEEPTQEYDLSNYEEEADEDDYSAVLSDARLRLEQGRLYEMLMNHDIFDGLAADAAAVKSVQRQIRKWAKEQMEIMLGMRRETAKVERLDIEFPFNQVEVEVLKLVAKTASKGRTENSDKFVPEVKRVTEEVPFVQPRKEGLNRIGSPAPAPTPKKVAAPAQPQRAAPAPQKPVTKLQQKPVAPVNRPKTTLNSAQQKILAETGLTQAEIDATMDSEAPLTKDPSAMTTDELIAHNGRAAQRRHKTVKNPAAVPMPSPDQEAMLIQSRIMDTMSAPPPGLAAVLSAMSGKK